MTNTVDVVIVGTDRAAIAATTAAAGQGQRVLVVMRSRRADVVRRIRGSLRHTRAPQWAVKILTGAEVACVDGVNTVEAVLVRDLKTGRLRGFNAAGLQRYSE